MLCSYGCGNQANFKSKSNKDCCVESYKKCPAVLRKNREGTQKAREEGRKGYTYNEASCWNKGTASADFSLGGKGNHKAVLILEKGHTCENCKLAQWMGQDIPLELDHIDGNNFNNERDNLRLLCPNCHAQTPTWRRRKTPGSKQTFTDEEMIEAIKTSKNLFQCLNKLQLAWGSGKTILRVQTQYGVQFMGS